MPHTRKHHLDTLAISIRWPAACSGCPAGAGVKATVAEVAPVFQAFVRFAPGDRGGGGLVPVARVPWAMRASLGATRAGLLAGSLLACEFTHLCGPEVHHALRLTVFFVLRAVLGGAAAALHSGRGPARLAVAGPGGAFVGVGWRWATACSPHQRRLPRAWLGDLLGLAGGLLWALTTVVLRSTRLARWPAKQLFYQVAVSAAALPPAVPAAGERWSFDFSTFATCRCWYRRCWGPLPATWRGCGMLAHYPATKISVFVFLTPVFALMFGAWWLAGPSRPPCWPR